MAFCWTNILDTARWLLTFLCTLPWKIVPALALLIGFFLGMVGYDVLHIWHLGVGRDVCGSILRLLVADKSYFQGRTIPMRLKSAYWKCRSWAVRNNKKLRLSKFTKANLNWKSHVFPTVKCKGSDTMIIMCWLVEELTQRPPQIKLYPQILTCLFAAHVVLQTASDMFLLFLVGFLSFHTFRG